MPLPVKIRKIYKDIKSIDKKRKTILSVAVIGKKDAGKTTLINCFGRPRFDSFIEVDGLIDARCSLIIVVIPADKEIDIDTLQFLTNINLDDYLVVLNKTDNPTSIDNILDKFEALNIDFGKVIPVSAKSEYGINELKQRIVASLGIEKIALAYQLPRFATGVITSIQRATALQNAMVAIVSILPGADMPIITANQIKMVLEIAAIFGVKMDTERAKEIIAVISSGYAFRQVARQLLTILPGPGWIIKGVVAYFGTLALSRASVVYFKKVVSK